MFARRMCGGNYRELVGAEGFEPSAFCSRSKRATRLRYAPTSKRMSIVYSFFLFMSNGVSAKIANQRLVPTISVALGMIAWADRRARPSHGRLWGMSRGFRTLHAGLFRMCEVLPQGTRKSGATIQSIFLRKDCGCQGSASNYRFRRTWKKV